MRRQLGADAVDLDTREGIARYALVQPRTIDTADVERALYGAGYTLVEMRIEISGTVVRRPCERCGREVAFLQADGTGQLFELAGPDPPNPSDGRVRVRGVLRDWDGDHARLEIEGSESLP